MAAGLGALGDDEVAAGVECAPGVFDLAAHRDDEHAVSVAEVDDVRRDAESGDEGARAALDQEFDVLREGLGEAPSGGRRRRASMVSARVAAISCESRSLDIVEAPRHP